ncbi:Phosphorylase b kinase regulatory subunit [Aphelenchoides besseyi]|nr:Phosphorylase b kinase regulatory subunit [Aphelenchoides besseyi]
MSERNKRLRRFTQAYLSPLQLERTKVSQSRLSRVDSVYAFLEKFIIENQNPTSGLFPRYSIDKSVGYVKDSIWCAFASWATATAYQRLDDDRGRTTELRQTAVKTMRGILFSWMQQVDKINAFKTNHLPEFALHARFCLQTGLEIPSTTFGHLQMDLIGLYILILVKMTVAGTQVVFTMHEVSFLQNLVFYCERAYRMADFGMWERGNRYNNGTPELSASSVGLVKAALEAVNGLNLFGQKGTSASVIYVDIDGHNRNRTTFETILPRESNSKNTDAALLMAVGWPAFATHDHSLYESTLNKCVRHLEGRFGLKRFLRDGYRTEKEDTTKAYYTKEETYNFRGVESQFPMFLLYIVITAHFKGNDVLADRYWEKLQSLTVPAEYCGASVVPECYCIEEDHMDAERESPNSQDFYAVNPAEFGVHLWSNALYVIAILIREKLVHLSDIDPIYRHLPASLRPKSVNRHSAFERDNDVILNDHLKQLQEICPWSTSVGRMEGDPVVQIALISESAQLQMMLATYGITTQTPHEVEPVQIWPSWRMVKVFEHLGRDSRLKLGGRPPRPFGPLNTSKIFRIRGETIICYPLTFELSDFYNNADPSTLIEDVKRDIEFIARRWKLAGHPTFCIILREANVVGEYFQQILDLLVGMKNGFVNRTRVRIGRIHQLLNTGCMEYIDFVNLDDIEFDVEVFKELDVKNSHRKSRSSIKTLAMDEEQTPIDETPYRNMEEHSLFTIITQSDVDSLRELSMAIAIMMKRYGGNFVVQGDTLHAHLERAYRVACQTRDWSLVRYCASYLHKIVTSLAPGLTSMLIRGKQVIIGMKSCVQITISAPSTPDEIASALFSGCCSNSEPQAAAFQQELIIACADLIVQHTHAFDGVLTIRLEWLTRALQLLLEYVKQHGMQANELISFLHCSCPLSVIKQLNRKKTITVYDLPPTVVRDLLSMLMTRKNWHILTKLQVRRLNGAVNRCPPNLYNRVWDVLEKVKGGIIIAGHLLPQHPTLLVMAERELTFAYQMEAMMSDIPTPEHRQLLVELLSIVALMFERNPEIAFADTLDCDKLVERAFQFYRHQHQLPETACFEQFYDNDQGVQLSSFLIQAVVEKLLAMCDLKSGANNLHEDAIGELIFRRRTDEFCPIS